MLKTPVDIFQHEPEFRKVLDIYRRRRPRRVLEIGTFTGGTLYHWLRCAPPGALVVSLDLYEDPANDNRRRYRSWTPAGVRLVAIEGNSHDPAVVSRVARYKPFEWLFIDADHSYEAVKADWELYRPMVKKGGIVCLHDIVPPPQPVEWMEVHRFWKEIQAEHVTRSVVDHPPQEQWGGIGIVYL